MFTIDPGPPFPDVGLSVAVPPGLSPTTPTPPAPPPPPPM